MAIKDIWHLHSIGHGIHVQSCVSISNKDDNCHWQSNSLYKYRKKEIQLREEVEAAHAQFTTALHELFDTEKTRLGYGDRQLEII